MTWINYPYNLNTFVQQGWQCPVCHRVYSPTTAMCFVCPQKFETTGTVTFTTGYNSIEPEEKK